MRLLPHEHKFEKQVTSYEWWSPIHRKLMRRVTGHHYQYVVCSLRVYSDVQAHQANRASAGARRVVISFLLPFVALMLAVPLMLWWVSH